MSPDRSSQKRNAVVGVNGKWIRSLLTTHRTSRGSHCATRACALSGALNTERRTHLRPLDSSLLLSPRIAGTALAGHGGPCTPRLFHPPGRPACRGGHSIHVSPHQEPRRHARPARAPSLVNTHPPSDTVRAYVRTCPASWGSPRRPRATQWRNCGPDRVKCALIAPVDFIFIFARGGPARRARDREHGAGLAGAGAAARRARMRTRQSRLEPTRGAPAAAAVMRASSAVPPGLNRGHSPFPLFIDNSGIRNTPRQSPE